MKKGAGAQALGTGLWTPKAVMKILTTTMIKTKAVVMFSMMFSLKCMLSSFRFHLTDEREMNHEDITEFCLVNRNDRHSPHGGSTEFPVR